MRGPKDGKYVAYHATTESGAEDIAAKGIDSTLLGNPEEFQTAIDPAKSANFSAGAVEDAGGGVVNLVRFEIPEDLFLDLLRNGHIKTGVTTGSLVSDQIAQAAINRRWGDERINLRSRYLKEHASVLPHPDSSAWIPARSAIPSGCV
jgi:hypothetical protein